jgi:hypothetical protein
MPVCVEDFCRAWPFEAGMELSALRTGNAALVERLNGLQRECRLQQDLAEQAQERVKRLEEAGDAVEDAVQSVQDWNGTYIGECLNEWAKAKAAK